MVRFRCVLAFFLACSVFWPRSCWDPEMTLYTLPLTALVKPQNTS
jgi:hypothetical protein